LRALNRLEIGDSVSEVARCCKIDVNVLRRWRRDYERAPESAFPGPGRPPKEGGIEELQRQIERHAQKIDHLMQRIQSAEGTRMPQARMSTPPCETSSTMGDRDNLRDDSAVLVSPRSRFFGVEGGVAPRKSAGDPQYPAS
jgi:transposase-like protein